jgi:hypothetical protein
MATGVDAPRIGDNRSRCGRRGGGKLSTLPVSTQAALRWKGRDAAGVDPGTPQVERWRRCWESERDADARHPTK